MFGGLDAHDAAHRYAECERFLIERLAVFFIEDFDWFNHVIFLGGGEEPGRFQPQRLKFAVETDATIADQDNVDSVLEITISVV